MKVLVTGGAGFIGSHIAEYYAKQGCNIVVLDNLSRAKLLKGKNKNFNFNWNYLKNFSNIKLVKEDIRNFDKLNAIIDDMDVIFHTAAQTAVTTSINDPETDFTNNAIGTFNVLETARKANKRPIIIYCSTNKVYGENVNKIDIIEKDKRYEFYEKFKIGIPETFNIDLCEHTPYGCSKLTGDIYMQDYSHLYGLKIGVFRMSCIYGPRQFGIEDQGWVAWFTIATLMGKPITIYGNGKQVRDVLFIDDLIAVYDAFIKSDLPYGVFNIGGGPESTLSLLELLDILEKLTGKKSKILFSKWRPSDQKVYISNINKAKEELNWTIKTFPEDGVLKLVEWISDNKNIFYKKSNNSS